MLVCVVLFLKENFISFDRKPSSRWDVHITTLRQAFLLYTPTRGGFIRLSAPPGGKEIY